MPIVNSNLNKIFVYVPSDQVASFKSGAGRTAAYANRISFLGGTGEIMTNGEVFAVNREADITALETLIGANSSNILTNTGLPVDSGVTTIAAAIKYVYDHANDDVEDLDARLDVLEGTGEGSVQKTVNDAISELVANAPEALDTLKEIADWISNDQGQEAANLVTRMENIEDQVKENEQVTAAALIDLQQQLDDMTGGSGSINQQITAAIENLDSSVTLTGTTASQPTISTISDITNSIDVLGSITVAEVDGLLKQDQSAKVVLQADPAGAAKKVYDTLYGTDQDTTDAFTIKGVRARVDYKTRTGILSNGESSGTSLTYDTSTGELATVQNVAGAINSIQMWETYSAS